jgi:hypothetical protein
MATGSPELQALAAWKLAVGVESTAKAGRRLVVAGKPALIPLGVATPGAPAAPAAWAGTSEARQARSPTARTAAKEALR